MDPQPQPQPQPQLFKKVFTTADEKQILELLVQKGVNYGNKEFWIGHKDSMQLSFRPTETQLYEKQRRLKDKYGKGQSAGNKPMSEEELEVFELCKELWGEDEQEEEIGKEKEKGKNVGHREYQEKGKNADHREYQEKLNEFMSEYACSTLSHFPFTKAMEVVRASDRSRLENIWSDVEKKQREVDISRMSAIKEIVDVVRSTASEINP